MTDPDGKPRIGPAGGGGIETVRQAGLLFFRARRLAELGVPHAFTTRWLSDKPAQAPLDLGFSAGRKPEDVIANRAAVCEALGVRLEHLTFAEQVHLARAVLVGPGDLGRGSRSRDDVVEKADALVTNLPGASLAILTADCLPVLVYDRKSGAVAAVHAGWRGALAGVSDNALKLLLSLPGSRPENLIAVLGPAIQACCFEVQKDVARRFAAAAEGCQPPIVERRSGRLFVDLAGFVRCRLLRLGLLPDNIVDFGLCTCCLKDLFFSRRRDGLIKGSMAAIITCPKAAK